MGMLNEAKRGNWRKALAMGMAGLPMLGPMAQHAHAAGEQRAAPRAEQVQTIGAEEWSVYDTDLESDEAKARESEAKWDSALNFLWSKELTAKQRQQLLPEQRKWIKWKDSLPTGQRRHAVKARVLQLQKIVTYRFSDSQGRFSDEVYE